MTHEAMLKKLGLTEAQFGDLLKKHADFMNNLDTAQQKAVKRSMPTLTEAAASFGPNASVADLRALIKKHKPSVGTLSGINLATGKPQ